MRWEMTGGMAAGCVVGIVDSYPRCSPVTLSALHPLWTITPKATLPLCAEDSISALAAPGHVPFWHWHFPVSPKTKSHVIDEHKIGEDKGLLPCTSLVLIIKHLVAGYSLGNILEWEFMTSVLMMLLQPAHVKHVWSLCKKEAYRWCLVRGR